MERLRFGLLSLLVVMMLPWGAYVRAAQVATPPDAPAVLAQSLVRAGLAPHRCRTATLPGSVCSLEFLADDAGLTPKTPPDGITPVQDDDTPASPWHDAVPLPPPRLD